MAKPIFHVYIPDRALFDAQFVTVDPDGKYQLTDDGISYRGFFQITKNLNNKTLALMKLNLQAAETHLRPLVDAGLCSCLGTEGTILVDDVELPAMHTTIRDTAELSDADILLVKEVWPEGFEPVIDEEGNEIQPAKMWGRLA